MPPPKTGTVIDGYKFKGGDPNQKSSWEKVQTPSRSMAPGRTASLGDFMAWRQDAMGDLGRSEPQTSAEAYSGGRGAAVGLAATGAIAAPVAALKMAGRGVGAYAVEEGVDYGAQAVGVPPYWADKMGDAAGWMTLIGSGGLTRLISMLGPKAAKEKLKRELVQVVVKNESDKLRTTAILRTQGYTSAQIEKAIIMEAPKAATKTATAAAPAAAPTTARALDPLRGVDFNKAGGRKHLIAAVEHKAVVEGRGLAPRGWSPQGSYEPAKAAAKKAVKKVASPGAVRAGEHKALVAFGKQEAKGHKFGEKVWIELDKAGEPVRVMTPGQASHVAESSKTWIKRTWK